MKRTGTPGVRFFRFVLVVGLPLPVILAADGCPDGNSNSAINAVVVKIVEENVAGINITDSLRVHLDPEVLPEGTVVRPYSPIVDPGAPSTLTCTGGEGCRLFFVDTDHWAHFAHPTVIVLWDPSADRPNQRLRWAPGRWWPLVNDEPVFDTVRKREDWDDPADPDPMTTIVYPRHRAWLRKAPDQMDVSIIRLPSSEPSPVGVQFFAMPPPCRVWAVLVAGFNDPDDTFDTDIEGMETVLRGHGVLPGQIFVLSPRYNPGPTVMTTGDSVRLHANYANVEEVLTVKLRNAINNIAGGCGDFLFFFSSHGDADGNDGILECEGGPITDGDLELWLDQVPCNKVTVVLEACHSGAFIDELDDVSTAEFILQDGSSFLQDKRLLFTSTESDGRSRRDVDRLGGKIDTNPGDLGSETVWGYIEAFGTGIANSDTAQPVTFAEAFEYAEANDLSHQIGLNDPQIRSTCASDEIVGTCATPTGSPAIGIALTQETPTAPAGFGQLLRCRCNLFKAEVSYPMGGKPPPVSTARFFWTDVSNPRWDVNGQPHFKEIWNSTQLLPAQGYPHNLVVRWDVGAELDVGREITLLAIADSPHAPIPKGPMSLSDLLDQTTQASALTLEVTDPSSCFIFPCGCRTLRCD